MADQETTITDGKHEIEEFRILRQISSEINTTLELDEIFHIVLRTMDELFGFHHAIILLLEADITLRVAASRGYEDPAIGLEVPLGTGTIGVVAKRKRMMHVSNLRQQRAYAETIRKQFEETGRAHELDAVARLPDLPDAECQIAIPLLIKDNLIGVFSAESVEQRMFTEREEILISIVANQAAAAIHNARLFQAEANRCVELAEAHRNLLELNAELIQEKERAEAASQAKSVFLASMGHELRTPLNSILGFTQLMSRDKAIPGRHVEDLEQIQRSGEVLLGMVNNVLEMSRIESGNVSVDAMDFDLHRMVNDLRSQVIGRVEDKGLYLTLEIGQGTPNFVRADQEKLRQVLLNLLDNAIKFTEDGGVVLRTRYSTEKSRLELELEDTGSGIPSEDAERLFGAFEKPEMSYNLQEGIGLGLSIARHYINLMAGEISVESEVGKGSVFRFGIEQVRQNRANRSWNREQQKRKSIQRQSLKLGVLPEDFLSELIEQVARAEEDSVLRMIHQIEEDHPALAEKLSRLTREFRYDAIIDAARSRDGLEE